MSSAIAKLPVRDRRLLGFATGRAMTRMATLSGLMSLMFIFKHLFEDFSAATLVPNFHIETLVAPAIVYGRMEA